MAAPPDHTARGSVGFLTLGNLMGGHRCSRTMVCPMERSLPPSPAHLVGLRRAARVYLGEVASEAADDIVLTLNEAAANAILYGSGGGSRSRWSSTSATT